MDNIFCTRMCVQDGILMMGSVFEQQAVIFIQEERYTTWNPHQMNGVFLKVYIAFLSLSKIPQKYLVVKTTLCLGPILAKFKEKLVHKMDDTIAIKLVKEAIFDDLDERWPPLTTTHGKLVSVHQTLAIYYCSSSITTCCNYNCMVQNSI